MLDTGEKPHPDAVDVYTDSIRSLLSANSLHNISFTHPPTKHGIMCSVPSYLGRLYTDTYIMIHMTSCVLLNHALQEMVLLVIIYSIFHERQQMQNRITYAFNRPYNTNMNETFFGNCRNQEQYVKMIRELIFLATHVFMYLIITHASRKQLLHF